MGTLPLLALLFGALVCIGLLIKRRTNLAKARLSTTPSIAPKTPVPDLPVPFGYKCAWYAVKGDDPKAVAIQLKLRQLKPSTWSEGVEGAYGASVFISPPLRGWILAVGTKLFPAGPALEDMSSRVVALSRVYGLACFFATDRITETHMWARATDGVLDRGYAYSGESGEVVWDSGRKSEEEVGIGSESPDEEVVMEIARKWSISPVDIPFSDVAPGLGLLGRP